MVVGDRTFTEEELLREGRVFVVLAEPGAGKTELLNALAARLQSSRIKASVFRNRQQVAGRQPLVIDAMDEVARVDSLATDQIIAQASDVARGTVVFAGRSGEWDQGRTSYVEQCFGVKPTVVYLEPFTQEEQRQLFAAEFSAENFDDFAAEVDRFELSPLLGNPQFLKLLGGAYLESGRVFVSKARIFSDAVRRLAHEVNPDLGRQKNKPSTETVVAQCEAVFAKLMLSGAAGVATVEQLSDRDFPYIGELLPADFQSSFLLDTRLFKPSDDVEKHEPVHRIVAEYCAAGYLVRRISDPGDRLSLERLFSIIAPNKTTRDELRGMLGWMAARGGEPLQMEAIRLDPYAVLANGDPGQLTPRSKRALLTALDRLADKEPLFRRSDAWRRFNVGHFFTSDVLDDIRGMLAKPGSLRSLVVELLEGTDAASDLAPSLSQLATDETAEEVVRQLAMRVLLQTTSYDGSDDFAALLTEGSPMALELASRIIIGRGMESVGRASATDLLSRLGSLYPEPGKRDRSTRSRSFIDRLIRTLERSEVATFLDELVPKITCTCKAKSHFSCKCRQGQSKVVARLVDRFFEALPFVPEPARLWRWLEPLHFRNGIARDRSAAVKYLTDNGALRRALQQLAVANALDEQAANDAIMRLYSRHSHSGIVMCEGDREALSQYAFDNGLTEVWAALWAGHDPYQQPPRPNLARRIQRQQSRSSRQLQRIWSLRDRRQRDYQREERQSFRIRAGRYARREAEVEAANWAHLRANLEEIEAGRNWSWLDLFARTYLLEPDKLATIVDDPETPLRALRNCFPMLTQYAPSVEDLARRRGTGVAEALLAGCIVRVRDGESLDGLDRTILTAVKTEATSYPCFAEGEEVEFEFKLDAALFIEDWAAEDFLRRYMEGQLSSSEVAIVSNIHWLDHKEAFKPLRSTLPIEWLERFPLMPLNAARSLFSIAAKHASRDALCALIDQRLDDAVPDAGDETEDAERARVRKQYWQANAFLYQTARAEDAWNELKADPRTLLALKYRIGRYDVSSDGDRPPVTAEMLFTILDAFIDVWPKVHLPNSFGSSDPDDEKAYRFIIECVHGIGNGVADRRAVVIERMLADGRFADFRDLLMTMRAEAGRELALQDFRAPSPADINRLIDRNDVASVEDMRALVVEELGEVQKWLQGSETDPLDVFYPGGKRVDENTARNRIVDRLQGRMTALGLSVTIERHMARSNRCDITASAVIQEISRLLVVEVKGQWNKELFTAASAQLDARYAIHPDAARQGVYLVLWYGNGEKIAGLSDATVTTAAELQEKILAPMPDELRRRIDVVVLDLSRPQPTKPKSKRRRAGSTAVGKAKA
ncbi:conserved hypothetical protein [Agrobacterium tumefaciens str. Kerr 14]|uniref:Uncharacterized protein n=1 Tax=Agrobacterium tumefaciens str. Kerr 14 TaxID=1183424 RepID=A0A1S7SCH6_AGRTU|nr:conserved hypothetical protein [Agrobacterium tumefaciens str. Kerr 14]